ncbi:hypothetical protein DQ04_11401000 [Trypanosoma grayi]|uniref:hypothetical protein n=1 Tax=Trypanosoma grayi TaxID=71804 RepID=UPI0004F47FF9|nr:hypothetical protein DQ04_11401000 [Trypanosoma grayi]KEG06979.1 hypothetical protein DQ04_11401000 [Trypanosoma grayi]
MLQQNPRGPQQPSSRTSRRASFADASTPSTSTSSSYSASSYSGSEGGSGSKTASYSGGSDIYSYSYSGSTSSTGSETVSKTSNMVQMLATPSSRSPQPKQQQQQKWELQLPPRVPQPSPQVSPSNVAYARSADISAARSVGSVSESSESYSVSGSGGESGSGSYSYSHSEEDEGESEGSTDSSGSGSYSYSSKSTPSEDLTEPPKRAGVCKAKESESSSSYTYSGSTMTTGESSVTAASESSYSGTTSDSYGTGFSATSATGSSGSYSYSTDRRTSSSTSRTLRGGRELETSSSQTGTTVSGSTDATKKSTDGDSYSYSYSYSYSSKDGSGSVPHRYSSTTSTESGESEMSLTTSGSDTRSASLSSSSSLTRKATKDLPPRHPTSSVSATTTTTSLITGDTGTQCGSGDSPLDDVTSAYTASVGGPSRTTTATGMGQETVSVEERELIVLATPPEEAPRIHQLPRSCLVPRGSVNDTFSQFLDRLAEVQSDVLRREAEKSAAAAAAAAVTTSKNGSKVKKAKTSKKDTPSANVKQEEEQAAPEGAIKVEANIPSGHFIKRSIKFALKAAGVETVEECASVMKSLAFPVQRDLTLALLDRYAHQCLVRRLTSMFLTHDRFCSGEVSLGIALELLGRCGIANRVAGSVTMSLHLSSPKSRLPLLCVTQRVPPSGPPVAMVEGQEPPVLETQIYTEVVDVCSGVLRAGNTDVYWDERKGDIYVGKAIVARVISTHDAARSVIMQLEALIHVCLAIEACVVNEDLSSAVLYTPLLTALLPFAPGGAPNTKSIIVENAFQTVLNPMLQLEGLAAHRRLQEYHFGNGEDPVLRDTLPDRLEGRSGTTMQQQLRHNVDWAPTPSADAHGFEATKALTPNDVYCELGLKKLRLAEAAPAGARCYCLVSAKKVASDEWMPAVVVPVLAVKPSKKGGYKWTFSHDNTHRVFFAGVTADKLYIEACYDVDEATGVTATWCAGHTTMACSDAKSTTLPVQRGSLLTPRNAPAADGKRVTSSGGCFFFLRRKTNAPPATSLAIVVKHVQVKALPPRDRMPGCFLALRRHVPLMAEVRDAILSIGGPRTHPWLVLRQQQVQSCLAVAANPHLMDVMQVLWDRTLRGKIGTKPKDPSHRHKAILALAAKVVAVHNTIAGDPSVITDIVASGAAIRVPLNPQASQIPVCV